LALVRTYVVRAGDSPAKIAIEYAGCPKCTRDLVAANPAKATKTYPNGFVTFQSLAVGEVLNLPDKWFNGALDRLPQAYFDELPSMPVGVGLHGPQTQPPSGGGSGGSGGKVPPWQKNPSTPTTPTSPNPAPTTPPSAPAPSSGVSTAAVGAIAVAVAAGAYLIFA
jgi:hypothetical protein